MAETKDDVDLDALRANVTRQGAVVRQMKKDGAAQEVLTAAVVLLKDLKMRLAAATEGDAKDAFPRALLDDQLKRRMFIVPSFEIYGGVAGFYDFGPPACGLKGNLLAEWRQHFVMAESMLEIECTNLTPEIVLETSGHVAKFTDLMVKDVKTGECYRADKLLEEKIEQLLGDPVLGSEERRDLERVQLQADAFSPVELGEQLRTFDIKAPATGNELTEPFPFNLMFETQIGPEGNCTGYLRPETAQGIFVNFRRLLEFNAQKMPFAAAQIGTGFRNEISPRAGLLRVREFTMAEIEHFVKPDMKQHPRFSNIAHRKARLFPADNQVGDGRVVTDLTFGDAVATGVIDNETLAYFIARVEMFLQRVGIDAERLRFRQHLPTEMAHYATDCWDAEIQTSYGWIECVGIADRACYDLAVHAKRSKRDMLATHRLEVPVEVEIAKMKANKGLMGRAFKKELKEIVECLEAVTTERAKELEALLAGAGSVELTVEALGKDVTITRDMLSWTTEMKMTVEEKYQPSVIEPSFGIGRIMAALFEHSFYTRPNDENRGVLRFAPIVAPIKCSVLAQTNTQVEKDVAASLAVAFTRRGLFNKSDTSSTQLGRRYARMDELGVPFCVTVDTNSAADNCATVRERDSCAQIRVSIDSVVGLVERLVKETMTWDEARATYPAQDGGDAQIVPIAKGGADGDTDASATIVVESFPSTSMLSFSRPKPLN